MLVIGRPINRVPYSGTQLGYPINSIIKGIIGRPDGRPITPLCMYVCIIVYQLINFHFPKKSKNLKLSKIQNFHNLLLLQQQGNYTP